MASLFTGGRVLITVSIASTLALTAARATQAAQDVSFDGKQFRTDIAHKGIARYNTLLLLTIINAFEFLTALCKTYMII